MRVDAHLSHDQRALIGTTAYNLARSTGEERSAESIYNELCADAVSELHNTSNFWRDYWRARPHLLGER
jgi:hypothetical protein